MTAQPLQRPLVWKTSGRHLLDDAAEGRLAVSDDFLRAYLMRAELHPIEESCARERALHADLADDPRREVPPARLAQIADRDSAENYRLFLAFRDHLLAHDSLEAAYVALLRAGRLTLPPLFVDQMVHAICERMLEGRDDPFLFRAAELLFRAQRITTEGGRLMAADEEVVEMHAERSKVGPVSLVDMAQGGAAGGETTLDVLTEETRESYWARADRFDTVVDLRFTQPALDAFCRVLELWVDHFLGVRVAVQPRQSVRDEQWRWHLGLDSEASRLLNALYTGKHVGQDEAERLIALFQLDFADPAQMRADLAGSPVYLAIARTGEGRLVVKPQNLLFNLPLARAA